MKDAFKTENSNAQEGMSAPVGVEPQAAAVGGEILPSAKKFRKFRRVLSNWQYYVMVLPAMILFFLFTYMSMPGMLLAFQRYTITGGLFNNEWIGFENFQTFFGGPYFWRCTRNTFIINVTNLIFGTFFSVLFALLLNEMNSSKGKKIYQNILFLPTFLSVLMVARFLDLMLNNDRGVINGLFESMGFAPVMWYDTPSPWVGIIVFAYIWKGVGYNLIVYLAVIMGIDREIYEAASIDGAGRGSCMMHITVPLLMPTIIILSLFSIGKIFYGDFQLIQAVIGSSNYALMESLDIIETYLYRSVTSVTATPDYGVAGAVSMFQTVLGFVMIFGTNTLVKLYNKDYALF